MSDIPVARALDLIVRTLPFVLFRMAVCLGIAIALVVLTAVGAGFGQGIGAFGTDAFQAQAVFWGGVAGFGAVAGMVFARRAWLLFVVRAGHIAAMVAALRGQRLPPGRAQIDMAVDAVGARYGDAAALFALRGLVRRVVRAVTGLAAGPSGGLSMPGAVLHMAPGLVDAMIIAHPFRAVPDNPWAGAREGLVLYARNAGPLRRDAARLTLIGWGLTLVVFLLMLAPAAAVARLFPGDPAMARLVFAAVFAGAVKAALVEPFLIACVLSSFFRATDGQPPQADWTARLTDVSEPFRHMGAQADVWMRSGLRMSSRN